MIGDTSHYPQSGLVTRPAGSLNGVEEGALRTNVHHAEHGGKPVEAALPIVVLEAVSKRFNDIYALRDTTVTVFRGETYGLLGPTGSGKSTLLRLVLGFLRADEGKVEIFGAGEPSEMAKVRGRIGYLPEHPQFHFNFTGLEHLRFQARLCGLTRRNAQASADRMVEMVGGAGWIKRRVGYYTPEMLHRLGLGVALVGAGMGYPELLLLDEPSSHLERSGQMAVRDILMDCKRNGTTILMASHKVTEVERVCSKVGVLKAGRMMLQTEVENNPRTIIIAVPRERTEEGLPVLMRTLRSLHPTVALSGGQAGGPLMTSLPAGEEIRNASGIKAAALRLMVEAGWDVISIYIERRDLESIYAQTLSPVVQAQTGIAATGPLVTGPLGTTDTGLHMGAMTGPLEGRVTGPLRPYNGSDDGSNTR